jgi:hypothetical protein
VVIPDWFGGTALSSIPTSNFKHYLFRAISLSYDSPKYFIYFCFFNFFFIAHFLLVVENTYKNPFSLKAVNLIRKHVSLKELESWLERGQKVQNWRQYWRHNRNPVNSC